MLVHPFGDGCFPAAVLRRRRRCGLSRGNGAHADGMHRRRNPPPMRRDRPTARARACACAATDAARPNPPVAGAARDAPPPLEKAMTIRIEPGDKREIAETLGRYFEARSIPFHIEEHPADVLHIGFHADGHPAAVTVTFDEDAFAAFAQWDIEQKRLALRRLADEFAEMMAQRSPTAHAGDLHINRF
ncbi:hypothetical protein [Burkholderia pseudomallei]|uniref:hypothetical protein n=1 Tax=Burkholderia pseudomallei TaxID=28450 RepID=UPI000B2EEA03|nr:hypothetical protein [Burkholderia pseudomallei]